ncbi:hypothetical protein K402DRAFT_393031, partial [Aulographum hederae CBS 113979]
MTTMLVQVSQSAQFSLDIVKEYGRSYDMYFAGIFELGVWTCETKDFPPFAGSHSLAEQCGLSSALRVSLIFQFVLTASLLVVIWWDKREHRKLFAERRYIYDEDGDVELDCSEDQKAGKKKQYR